MTPEGDSGEYELLTEAAAKTTVPGLLCEVGTRLGGGVAAILEKWTRPYATFLTIDPYGNVPYEQAQGVFVRLDYTNDMLIAAMTTLPRFCADKGVIWLPFIMEDTEFFRRYPDGVPLYNHSKRIVNEYAFIHIDGPHSEQAVLDEINFFLPRIPVGGAIAFDDIHLYDHGYINNKVQNAGFGCEAMGECKAVYRRL